jgi:hypothetical protein
MNSFDSSRILEMTLQAMWFILPIISLVIGIYAKNNFKGSSSSSLILAGAIIQLVMMSIRVFVQNFFMRNMDNDLFDIHTFFQTSSFITFFGHLIFVIGVLNLLKEIKAGGFANKTNQEKLFF